MPQIIILTLPETGHQTGNFTEGSGTVNLNGTADQSISNPSDDIFNNLIY